MAGQQLMTIRMDGADELAKTLRLLGPDLEQKVYLQSLRKGATLTRDEAKSRAPYGNDFSKRAYVKRSKGIARTHLVKLRNEVRMTVTLKTPVSYAIAVHVGVAYWGMFQEFGTSKMGARPWLRPAWDATAAPALDIIGKSLGQGVEKSAVRLAGPLAKSGLVRRR